MDPPQGIHLTWQNDDTAHTMTVTWQSTLEGSGETVLYDTVARGGDTGLYRFSTEGVTHTYTGASGFIHDVELEGLQPETVYYFVCGGGGGWSREMAFKTGPLGRRDVRFVVGGDSRTNPQDRDMVSEAMSRFDPSFVLFSGDMVNDGFIQDQWDSFLGHMDEYWTGYNGLTIPLVPALGNHEKNSEKYFEQFALPGNEEWFSLDWGPDLHIIVLSSEATLEGIKAQTEWLEEDLEEHASFPWKVVLLHRNILKSYHDSWLTALNRWVPVFDRHGVDLVVTGHSHNYMRSNPVNWTASHEEAMPSYSEGVMYLSSGGWGAPLYETVDGWWVAYTESVLHFTLIDIFTNGTLHVQAKGVNGETFDEVRVDKEIPDIGELMKTRLAEAESEIEALNQENEKLLSEKAALEDRLEILRTEVQTTTERVEGLVEQLSDIQDQLDASGEGCEGLLEEKLGLEELMADLALQLEEAEADVERLGGVVQQRTMTLGAGLVIAIAALAVLASRLRSS
jgi:hypothetical protein